MIEVRAVVNEVVKRSGKGEATEKKILEVALHRIIKHGESGVSMTEICRDVGISRPTIYRYFPTREVLLESTFDMLVDDYLEKLEQVVGEVSSPLMLVDVITDFSATRLHDGGAQMFQLEPSLVVRLMSRSHNRMVEHGLKVFASLFDMQETLTGRAVDRRAAVTAYLLFSTSLSFFGVDSFSLDSKDLLKKMIRVLPHFED